MRGDLLGVADSHVRIKVDEVTNEVDLVNLGLVHLYDCPVLGVPALPDVETDRGIEQHGQ